MQKDDPLKALVQVNQQQLAQILQLKRELQRDGAQPQRVAPSVPESSSPAQTREHIQLEKKVEYLNRQLAQATQARGQSLRNEALLKEMSEKIKS